MTTTLRLKASFPDFRLEQKRFFPSKRDIAQKMKNPGKIASWAVLNWLLKKKRRSQPKRAYKLRAYKKKVYSTL